MFIYRFLCCFQEVLANEQRMTGHFSLGASCHTSLIQRLATVFQGWRRRVSSVSVPDHWREEGVWRILQRVQGGIPKVGPVHRCSPCPEARIGKKLCYYMTFSPLSPALSFPLSYIGGQRGPCLFVHVHGNAGRHSLLALALPHRNNEGSDGVLFLV